MVALTILAAVIALAIQASRTGVRLAATALENRRAANLLQALIEADGRQIGERQGRSQGLSWRIQVALAPTDPRAPGVRLCSRAIEARDGQGRAFRLSDMAFCAPPGDGAADQPSARP
jgi:hypothetical protein